MHMIIISIAGMTCDNCARHVKTALLGIPGVRSADVRLDEAQATIHADAAVSREAIAAALDDAGYALA